jgi:flagellin
MKCPAADGHFVTGWIRKNRARKPDVKIKEEETMRINHNIAAMNTYNKLTANNAATAKSLEKLSSGLKINRAGDNAAGLAISEKMRAQIRGLDQANTNAQDSVSLIQTAEGGLNETHSILQRMRELAVQSANDTNTSNDRAEIQKELNQLVSEIDRISSSTEFNTKKLLNGDSGNKVIYANNTNVSGATVTNDNIVAGTYTVTVSTAAEAATTTGNAFADAAITAGFNGSQSITVNGQSITFTGVAGDAAATATNFLAAVNSAGLGIAATGSEAGITLTTNSLGADQSITIGASDLTAAMGLTADNATDATDTGVNVAGTINGLSASGSGTSLTSVAGDSIGLKVTLTNTAAGSAASKGSVQVTKNMLTAHIGANENQTMTLNISSMSSVDLSVNAIDLSTQSGAETAITTIQNAIDLVSSERAKLGAYQNRLEHTSNNLSTSSENLSAAESRIRDVDMAKEMMEFQKNSILNQASTAMLAQANQQPQGVLQLLQ